MDELTILNLIKSYSFDFLSIIFSMMIFAYCWATVKKDLSVADIFWPLYFLVTASFFYQQGPHSNLSTLTLILVILWSLRLFFYITIRNFKKGPDRRYVELSSGWKNPIIRSFTKVFLSQAIFALIFSLPLICVMKLPLEGVDISHLVIQMGLTLMLVGFIFETVADFQLGQLVKNLKPGAPHVPFTKGLWGQCRHPNYFGEILFWWGLYLLTIPYLGALNMTILSPLGLTFVLLKVTGIPFHEKKWQRLGLFDLYLNVTNALIPKIIYPIFAPVIFVIGNIIFALNIFFWLAILYPFVFFKIISGKYGQEQFKRIFQWIHNGAVGVDDLWLRGLLGLKIQVEGPLPSDKSGQFIIVGNHQSLVDAPVLQGLLGAKIPHLRFLVKSQLLKNPVLGPVCFAYEFPTVVRKQGSTLRNLNDIKKKVSRLQDHAYALIIFLEGTRLGSHLKDMQKSHYKNLLNPKIRGLHQMLVESQKGVEIWDVSIFYKGKRPHYFNVLSGMTNSISVKFNRVTALEKFVHLKGSVEELTEEVHQIWQSKDQWLQQMHETTR
jgi:1-acyl-sn-glycerol-3-phosphate acyltransferase